MCQAARTVLVPPCLFSLASQIQRASVGFSVSKENHTHPCRYKYGQWAGELMWESWGRFERVIQGHGEQCGVRGGTSTAWLGAAVCVTSVPLWRTATWGSVFCSPIFAMGKQLRLRSGLDMTTFFFLCWMFGGKARGRSLSFHCRKWITTQRFLSWCLPKQREERCWWWFSSCFQESCVSEAADLGDPADSSIHRSLSSYTVGFLDQNQKLGGL